VRLGDAGVPRGGDLISTLAFSNYAFASFAGGDLDMGDGGAVLALADASAATARRQLGAGVDALGLGSATGSV
jgi:hypothetical protein